MEVTSTMWLLQRPQFLLCTARIQAPPVCASSPGSVEGLSTFSDHRLMPKQKMWTLQVEKTYGILQSAAVYVNVK